MEYFDDETITNVLFYPRKQPILTGLGVNISAIKIPVEDNVCVGGYFVHRNNKFPTLVHFHGNGEIASDWLDSENYFTPDVNLIFIDYRGYGFSDGHPKFSSMLYDALEIVNYVRQYLRDNDYAPGLIIFGRSLGGISAVEIGSKDQNVLGLIVDSSFGDFLMSTKRLTGKEPSLPKELFDEISSHIKIRKAKSPTLIIHGTHDEILPYENGEQLFENVKENHILNEMLSVEQAGHNTISLYREYWDKINEFIEKVINL